MSHCNWFWKIEEFNKHIFRFLVYTHIYIILGSKIYKIFICGTYITLVGTLEMVCSFYANIWTKQQKKIVKIFSFSNLSTRSLLYTFMMWHITPIRIVTPNDEWRKGGSILKSLGDFRILLLVCRVCKRFENV